LNARLAGTEKKLEAKTKELDKVLAELKKKDKMFEDKMSNVNKNNASLFE